MKPLALTQFYRALHARGESTATLAARLHVSRAVVTKLIGLLKPRRGPVWRGLLSLLTAEERALLVSVEQCSVWNARARAARPRWTAEKVAGLAETYGRLAPERDRLRARAAA